MLGVRIRDAEIVGEEHAVEGIDQVDNLNRISVNRDETEADDDMPEVM